MIGALSTAATGLEAQQQNIERIANDIANVNTDGYKRSTVDFSDLYYKTIREPGAQLGATAQSPTGIQIGTGVKVGSVHKIFEPGPPKMTYAPLDIMIQGKGFFVVQSPNGEIAFSKNGAFRKDSQGRLHLADNSTLSPQITIPTNATDIRISPQGEVIAVLPGEGEAQLGQIQLATFANEAGLKSLGSGLFKASSGSGAPIQTVPGENGTGELLQGALEASNVNVATSMIDMITAQRGYEMQTKVMAAADDVLKATVNIR